MGLDSKFKFHEELIALNIDAANKEEAIAPLAALLQQNGCVNENFGEAILLREVEYPTGLPTEPFGTALPHTNPEHVNFTSVAVGVLKHPVQFATMGAPDVPVMVKVIFVLAIKEAHAQVSMIQFIVETLQQADTLETIASSSNPKSIAALLNSLFDKFMNRESTAKR